MHRIVGQQMRHRADRAEVVDCDEVDVGTLSLRGPIEVAADPAKTVDSDAYGHLKYPCC